MLLRDNKQSGPYSIEELKSKGLKPYDLVWVDGKSAAWRYPGEVEELKSFAPVVEEQPFDRFFRKPSQQSSSSLQTSTANNTVNTASEAPFLETRATARDAVSVTPVAEMPVASVTETIAPVKRNGAEPVAAEPVTSAPGRRIIYVTMPVNTSKPAIPDVKEISEVKESVNPEPARSYSMPLPERDEHAHRDHLKAAALSIGQIPHQAVIEEDFSHRSEFGDLHFVEKRPHHGRSSSLRITRPLVMTLGVIALLAAGVFIGLSISGRFRGADQSSAGLTGSQAGVHANSPVPVYTTAVSNPGQSAGNPGNTSGPAISDPVPASGKTNRDGAQRKKTVLGKPKQAVTATQKPAGSATGGSQKDSALASFAQPVREASHRTDETADKESVNNAVVSQVSISTNKYNTGTFGGISELQLTVSNRSIHPLDLVVVEVQYIQANKKVYKTENLYFRGIGAGAALMQEAPRSSRGVKIQTRIILINSKELGLSYSGI